MSGLHTEKSGMMSVTFQKYVGIKLISDLENVIDWDK